MANRNWNPEAYYREGARVDHKGMVFEARMDIPGIRIQPGSVGSSAFWRCLPTIKPVKVASPASKPKVPVQRGYIVRDMAALLPKASR